MTDIFTQQQIPNIHASKVEVQISVNYEELLEIQV